GSEMCIRDRARIGHVDPARADAALEASGNRVKPAIVMARLGCSFSEADQQLANAGGVLRRVID
ncbi:MAG: N-acetylmuramic acid 6-phosphate etherase, partial [Proteobacteria bacterium]|nr:N-acetylmuramic acid 6-phosphate etherase [Pseudomonadota bacterium]